MQKTLNILLFWPGHAGHFLQFLLSLDSKTYPICHPDTDITTISSRKELYSYKDIISKYKTWVNFHINFLKSKDHRYTESLRIRKFIDSLDYDTYTAITTPLNYTSIYDKIQSTFASSIDNINYIFVELDPKLQYVIDDFKKNNNNYPTPPGITPKSEYQVVYDQFKLDYNPYVVKLENLFYGPDTFVTEYTNLNNHLNLPLHTQDALEMYNDWYNERRLGRLNIVKPE
jgi:hypothetical protein